MRPIAPGKRLDVQSELELIRVIRSRYGLSMVKYFGLARAPRLWVHFPPDSPANVRDVFKYFAIADRTQVFLYDERPYPGIVTRTTFGEVKTFVARFPEVGFRNTSFTSFRQN